MYHLWKSSFDIVPTEKKQNIMKKYETYAHTCIGQYEVVEVVEARNCCCRIYNTKI